MAMVHRRRRSERLADHFPIKDTKIATGRRSERLMGHFPDKDTEIATANSLADQKGEIEVNIRIEVPQLGINLNTYKRKRKKQKGLSSCKNAEENQTKPGQKIKSLQDVGKVQMQETKNLPDVEKDQTELKNSLQEAREVKSSSGLEENAEEEQTENEEKTKNLQNAVEEQTEHEEKTKSLQEVTGMDVDTVQSSSELEEVVCVRACMRDQNGEEDLTKPEQQGRCLQEVVDVDVETVQSSSGLKKSAELDQTPEIKSLRNMEEDQIEPEQEIESLQNTEEDHSEPEQKTKSLQEVTGMDATPMRSTSGPEEQHESDRTRRRRVSGRQPLSSKKKRKRKDIVRTHFGFREPGTSNVTPVDRGRQDAQGEIYLLVDDEEEGTSHSQEHEVEERSRTIERFAYPSREDPDAVEVERSDLHCLDESEYINDTVIDLYIKYIQRDQPAPQTKFHVFNSFFFKKLVPAVCQEQNEGSEEDLLHKLRKWTKGVNVLEKTYLLMPIHDRSHWSLAILCFCNTGCHILHLDSMKTGHSSNVVYEVLRRYILAEWTSAGKKATAKNIRVRKVKVPQQANEYDCGLFMLHFIEKFLSNAPTHFDEDMPKNMVDWFSSFEASNLRRDIRDILQGLLDGKHEECTAKGDMMEIIHIQDGQDHVEINEEFIPKQDGHIIIELKCEGQFEEIMEEQVEQVI